MLEEYTWAVFSLCTALFFSSLYITDRKFLSNQKLSPFVFSSFGTTVGALATIIIALFVTGGSFEISARIIRFGILIGLLGSLGSYSYYFALRNNEASHVAPFSKFTSVFSMIFAVLLLGESVNAAVVAGVLLVGLGGYFATERNRQGHPIIDKAVVMILFATFFWAIRGVPEKIILSDIHPLGLAAIAALTRSAISVGIATAIMGKELRVFASHLKKSSGDAKLLLLRGLFSAGSLGFYYYALSMAPVSRVLPLVNTDPIFTVLLGGIVLGEKNIKKKWVGALVAVIGAAMIVAAG